MGIVKDLTVGLLQSVGTIVGMALIGGSFYAAYEFTSKFDLWFLLGAIAIGLFILTATKVFPRNDNGMESYESCMKDKRTTADACEEIFLD